jgi:hypothetical protein
MMRGLKLLLPPFFLPREALVTRSIAPTNVETYQPIK